MESKEEIDFTSLETSMDIFLNEFGVQDIYSKILLEELFYLIKEKNNGKHQS